MHHISRSAIFYGQKAFIGIGFIVRTAYRLKVLWAHSRASFKCKRGQTTFHRYDKHVFAAVFLTHLAFISIEFIVRATHKRCGFCIAISIAVGCCCTIFQWNRNYATATGFLFHFAQCSIWIAVWCTNRSGFMVRFCALFATLIDSAFEFRASANVSQVYVSSLRIANRKGKTKQKTKKREENIKKKRKMYKFVV